MSLLDDARALQLGLGDLSTLTVNDLALLWRSLYEQGMDPVALRDALLAAVPELLVPYEVAAGELTASWYEDLQPKSPFIAKPAAVAPIEAIQASTRWALGPLFSPTSSPIGSPLVLLSGMAKRRVFDASRQTVLDNADAEGGVKYARYASRTACEFCRLLATRGEVYASAAAATRVAGRGKSAATNFRADGSRKRGGQAKGVRVRGSQKSGDKFHDHCKCIAVAVRPGTAYEPPSYVQQWDEQYIEASRGGGDTKAILARMRAAEK